MKVQVFQMVRRKKSIIVCIKRYKHTPKCAWHLRRPCLAVRTTPKQVCTRYHVLRSNDDFQCTSSSFILVVKWSALMRIHGTACVYPRLRFSCPSESYCDTYDDPQISNQFFICTTYMLVRIQYYIACNQCVRIKMWYSKSMNGFWELIMRFFVVERREKEKKLFLNRRKILSINFLISSF